MRECGVWSLVEEPFLRTSLVSYEVRREIESGFVLRIYLDWPWGVSCGNPWLLGYTMGSHSRYAMSYSTVHPTGQAIAYHVAIPFMGFRLAHGVFPGLSHWHIGIVHGVAHGCIG